MVSDAIRNKRMVVEVWQRPSGEEWQCVRRGSPADWSELEESELVADIDDSQLVMAVTLSLVQQQRVSTAYTASVSYHSGRRLVISATDHCFPSLPVVGCIRWLELRYWMRQTIVCTSLSSVTTRS